MIKIFGEEEFESLRALIGSTFQFVAGPGLWHALTGTTVYVVCSNHSLSIQAQSDEEEFQGEWEDFSRLQLIPVSSREVEKCVLDGFAYRKHMGEIVRGVFVIVDEIIGELDSVKNLDYVSHSGIVLQFDTGYICIAKHDHHQPVIKVTYLDDMSDEQVPQTFHRFDEDVNQKFYLKRILLNISAKG
jgi:hypothetical protein